jgi:hypothetical protein
MPGHKAVLSQLWARDNRIETNLMWQSCRKLLELLSEQGLLLPDVLCLPFAYHVNHSNPIQDRAGAVWCLQAEHRARTAFDR